MFKMHLKKSTGVVGMYSQTACGRNGIQTNISAPWLQFKALPEGKQCQKCALSKHAEFQARSDNVVLVNPVLNQEIKMPTVKMSTVKNNLIKVNLKANNLKLACYIALLNNTEFETVDTLTGATYASVYLDNAYDQVKTNVTIHQWACFLSALTKDGNYKPTDDVCFGEVKTKN